METQDSGRVADRCIMVIFGASGDLTTRKLLPALYNLARGNLLPKEFAILGFAKDDISDRRFPQTRARRPPAVCGRAGRLRTSATGSPITRLLHERRLQEPCRFRQLERQNRRAGTAASHAGQRPLLPCDAAAVLLRRSSASWASRGSPREDHGTGGASSSKSRSATISIRRRH